MLQEQLMQLSPLLAIFFLLTAFVLYVFYSTARHYRLKLVMGPALLLACVFAVPVVGLKLGYGWTAALPESFQYLAHKTVVVELEKRWIDVLVVSRAQAETRARLHRIPWSKKIEEVLDQAEVMKEGRDGGDIVITRKGASSQSGDSYPDYVPKRVLPSDEMPKEAAPQRRSPEHELPDGSRTPVANAPKLET